MSTPVAGGVPLSDDELAAIVVALVLLWPGGTTPEAVSPSAGSWRFSGRWWSRPITARRARPWVDPGF